jgi:hypothetical protein
VAAISAAVLAMPLVTTGASWVSLAVGVIGGVAVGFPLALTAGSPR